MIRAGHWRWIVRAGTLRLICMVAGLLPVSTGWADFAGMLGASAEVQADARFARWETAARAGQPWSAVRHWALVRDAQGRTVLHVAARWGRVTWLAPLAAYTAIDVADEMGRTALHEAAWGGQVAVLERLHVLGAALDRADRQGWQPLHLALFNQQWPAARWLIAQGVPVDTVTADGWTPLTLAILQDGCDLLPLLIQAGADPRATVVIGGQHHSPHSLAQSLNRTKCVANIVNSLSE